ncbi:MAG TPA: Ig-like domain repeat protein, partial [Terriglobales bacterium]|nr:Ig-like domain repeat protein [Terriglobales bacterium]
AVNPVTNKIYVTNSGSGTMTVIDGATNAATTIGTGGFPAAVAVNPATNRIYVAHPGNNNVAVIEGTTNAIVTMVNTGTQPTAIAINPVTNKIYVANFASNNVTVIDGATNMTRTVNAGSSPRAIAVNPVTNRIYVSNAASNNVTVMDENANSTSTVSAGTFPAGIAVNILTNIIYVANVGSNNVTVIDGATNATTTVGVGFGPGSVAVNALTNKIYVTNGNSNTMTVIAGATNATASVNTGTGPITVALNLATNKIYVANFSSNDVTVIDGTTNSTSKVGIGGTPRDMAVNPVSGKIYVANSNTNNVTVITEQQVQPIPLTTAITPLPGDTSFLPNPQKFQLTTASAYQPFAPTVRSVYFQIDTWQGPWLKASGAAPHFTAIAPPLLAGLHTLYVYATDVQFADSIQTGFESSPIPGAISAYTFLVAPAPTITSLSLTSGANPSSQGQALTFQATVTAKSAIPNAGDVQFMDGNTNLGPPAPLDGGGVATMVWSLLPVGVHNITAVYQGAADFLPSTSPTWTQVVMNAGGAGSSSSTTQLSAGPSQTFFRQQATFSVQGFVPAPGPGSIPPAGGRVILLDENRQLGPVLFFGVSGVAGYTTPLSVGTHKIQAVFLGSGSVNGSVSSVVTINTSPRPKPR